MLNNEVILRDVRKWMIENGGSMGYVGIRCDRIFYESCADIYPSRNLYQDAEFDEDGNLIYPYISDGLYKGFFDGGVLDGTCSIGLNAFDWTHLDLVELENLSSSLELLEKYIPGCFYITLLTGEDAEYGNDYGEIVIKNAICIKSYKIDELDIK